MALANNAPVNAQRLKDAAYIASIALPVNANNAATAWLDLLNPVADNSAKAGLFDVNAGASGPWPVTRYPLVDVATTASASGNSVNFNILVQHAPALANGAVDSTNAANLPIGTGGPAMVIQVVPTASATAATDCQFHLPPLTKRFIRALAVGGANVGDLSDATLTLQLLF